MYKYLICVSRIFSLILVHAFVFSAMETKAQCIYPFQNTKLSDEKRIDDLISRMTIEEKISLFSMSGIPRLGIRSAGGTEAIHGLVQGGPAWNKSRQAIHTTSYPQGYGLGQTWDVDLIQQIGSMMSYEARFLYQNTRFNRDLLILWAPNADLGRDPRWGRTEECYGEDPFLVGKMSAAMVKGIQGNDPKYWRAAALMKHFLANSNECDRTTSSSDFDDELFYNYYSFGFHMGITEGGANALMTAYNRYNGTPCTVHPMLRDILMKQWGFNGVISTDGGAFGQLVTAHKFYPSLDVAAAACIKAGTTRFLDNYRDALVEALSKHLVSEADLDDRCRGNLRVMLKLGLLDYSNKNPYTEIGLVDTVMPCRRDESKALARLAADKSVVLLKNDSTHLLPLLPQNIHRIAVIGSKADRVLQDWYGGEMPYQISPLAAIREEADRIGAELRYVETDRNAAAYDAAAWADVAIVCVGNDPNGGTTWMPVPPWSTVSQPSDGREDVDRVSLTLPEEDLVKSVYKANPHTVLVLISSFPYSINWSNEHIPAIIHTTQAHQELGHGVSDVLFGHYNPAGRTTQTWPQSVDQLPPMNDYNIRHGRTYMYFKQNPLYPFGHGLSYTSFDYANLVVNSHERAYEVSVDVTNSGSRDGEEVVQLYVRMPHDDAAMRLRGFQRIALKQGETARVTFSLTPSHLSLYRASDENFSCQQGTYQISVGSSSADIRLTSNVTIE